MQLSWSYHTMNLSSFLLQINIIFLHYFYGTNSEIEILDITNFLKTVSEKDDYAIPQYQNIPNLLNNSLIIILPKDGHKIHNEDLREHIQEHASKNKGGSEFMMNFPASRRYGVKKPNVTVPSGWTLKRRVEHMLRFHEIMNYMKDHYLSTRYFYLEAQRIRRTGEVGDELRRMLLYLDRIGRKNNVTKKVLDCYFHYKDKAKKPRPQWLEKTNNLVINTIKDPFNDNII